MFAAGFCKIYWCWGSFASVFVACADFCEMSLSQSFFCKMSLSQGSAQFRFIFLLFVRTYSSRLFAKFFDLRSWLSVSSPLRLVGTPSPLPRGSSFSNHAKTVKPEHITWNFIERFCISGKQKKGNSRITYPEKREPAYCLRTPSIFAYLSHGVEREFSGQYFGSYS